MLIYTEKGKINSFLWCGALKGDPHPFMYSRREIKLFLLSARSTQNQEQYQKDDGVKIVCIVGINIFLGINLSFTLLAPFPPPLPPESKMK